MTILILVQVLLLLVLVALIVIAWYFYFRKLARQQAAPLPAQRQPEISALHDELGSLELAILQLSEDLDQNSRRLAELESLWLSIPSNGHGEPEALVEELELQLHARRTRVEPEEVPAPPLPHQDTPETDAPRIPRKPRVSREDFLTRMQNGRDRAKQRKEGSSES